MRMACAAQPLYLTTPAESIMYVANASYLGDELNNIAVREL